MLSFKPSSSNLSSIFSLSLQLSSINSSIISSLISIKLVYYYSLFSHESLSSEIDDLLLGLCGICAKIVNPEASVSVFIIIVLSIMTPFKGLTLASSNYFLSSFHFFSLASREDFCSNRSCSIVSISSVASFWSSWTAMKVCSYMEGDRSCKLSSSRL